MTILNQYVSIAEETAYGAPNPAGHRGYESMVDDFQRAVEYVEGGGKRAGRSGLLAARRRRVDRGAVGRIEAVMLTRGEGLRLKNALGATTGPAKIAGTGESVSRISVTNGGSNYAAGTTTVTVAAPSGRGGTTASAAVVVDGNGAITAITVSDGGSGYTAAPVVTIRSSGSGRGAAATAILSPTVYRATFKADAQGPRNSYTAHVARSSTDEVMHYFQYSGCMITGWSVSVEQGGELTLAVDFDCQDENDLGAAPAAPTYPTGTAMFIYEDCEILVDGSKISSFQSFALDVDNMLDTERFFIEGASEKSKPIRNGVPTYEGTIKGEFADLTEWQRYESGAVFPIVLRAVGPDVITTVDGTDYRPEFKLELPACQYSGSTPQSTLDSVSTIELPFVGL